MKRILVALDSSPRAPEVLHAAGALARRTEARLLLLRAVGLPPEIPSRAYTLSPTDVEKLLVHEAERDLEALAATIPEGLFGGAQVHLEAPWEAICRGAQKEDVDLIVVGAHGYKRLERMLGTTAAKVVNHADRAVLVVRAPERLEARKAPLWRSAADMPERPLASSRDAPSGPKKGGAP